MFFPETKSVFTNACKFTFKSGNRVQKNLITFLQTEHLYYIVQPSTLKLRQVNFWESSSRIVKSLNNCPNYRLNTKSKIVLSTNGATDFESYPVYTVNSPQFQSRDQGFSDYLKIDSVWQELPEIDKSVDYRFIIIDLSNKYNDLFECLCYMMKSLV